MVVVKIEMWPKGDKNHKRDLATIAISNVGGDHNEASYKYAISNQFDSVFGTRENDAFLLLDKGANAWKKGILRSFNRNSGVVRLLHAVLKDAFR